MPPQPDKILTKPYGSEQSHVLKSHCFEYPVTVLSTGTLSGYNFVRTIGEQFYGPSRELEFTLREDCCLNTPSGWKSHMWTEIAIGDKEHVSNWGKFVH